MTLSRKLLAAALSITTLGTALTASTQQASAFPLFPHPHHHHGWGPGLGWGIAGGLALGALAATAAERTYYEPECRLVRRFDAYGNYLGRVRVCE